MLIVMCVLGLCQGMQPIVGFNYGAGKHKRVKDVLLLTIRIATLIVTVGFLASELFPRWLVRAFTDDPDLTAMAVHGMRLGYTCCFWTVFRSSFRYSCSRSARLRRPFSWGCPDR